MTPVQFDRQEQSLTRAALCKKYSLDLQEVADELEYIEFEDHDYDEEDREDDDNLQYEKTPSPRCSWN
jgi:hypothetical protein